jgi:hypothetical protein
VCKREHDEEQSSAMFSVSHVHWRQKPLVRIQKLSAQVPPGGID